jgi:hypothetical protein
MLIWTRLRKLLLPNIGVVGRQRLGRDLAHKDGLSSNESLELFLSTPSLVTKRASRRRYALCDVNCGRFRDFLTHYTPSPFISNLFSTFSFAHSKE